MSNTQYGSSVSGLDSLAKAEIINKLKKDIAGLAHHIGNEQADANNKDRQDQKKLKEKQLAELQNELTQPATPQKTLQKASANIITYPTPTGTSPSYSDLFIKPASTVIPSASGYNSTLSATAKIPNMPSNPYAFSSAAGTSSVPSSTGESSPAAAKKIATSVPAAAPVIDDIPTLKNLTALKDQRAAAVQSPNMNHAYIAALTSRINTMQERINKLDPETLDAEQTPQYTNNLKEQIKEANEQLTEAALNKANVTKDGTPISAVKEKRDSLQKQYNTVMSSDLYMQNNMNRWEYLASTADKLTYAEQLEASEAAKALRNAAKKLYPWGSTYNKEKYDTANGYKALAGILENRSDALKAFGINALTSFIPGLQSGYETSRNDPLLQKMRDYSTSDKNIVNIANNNDVFADMQRNHPIAATLGAAVGSTAQTAVGGEGLGALGVAKGIGADALLLGASEFLNASNAQDWKNPGQASLNVALNTGKGILAGIAGGALTKTIVSKVAAYLEKSGLSAPVVKTVESALNGLTSTVGTEAVNTAADVLSGKPVDTKSAITNIGIGMLFGTLEGLKSKYPKTSSEYKQAESLQEGLRTGEKQQDAAAFINAHAKEIQASEPTGKAAEQRLSSAGQTAAAERAHPGETAQTVQAAAVDKPSLDAAQQIKKAADFVYDFAETPESHANSVKAACKAEFQTPRQVEVAGGAGKNADYKITVDKGTLNNVVKGSKTSAEKIAALKNIDTAIQNAAFVRSGSASKAESGSTQHVLRHDFFEAPLTIGGEKYLVKFDVTPNKATGKNTIKSMDVTKAPVTVGENLVPRTVSAPNGGTDETRSAYLNQWSQALGGSGTPELANKIRPEYNGNEKVPYNEASEVTDENAKADNADKLNKAIDASWNDDNAAGRQNTEGAGKTSLDSDILIDSYKNMRNNPDVTGQAHHLNQDAAFRDVIPKNDGLCVELEGNAFRDVGSAHYSAHENLESFWNNFRSKGDLYGDTPKISDYNSALYDSLRAAGLSDAQAKVAVQNAVKQQSQYGLVGDSFVPRIPGRINFKR
jgi:hypothetical protein